MFDVLILNGMVVDGTGARGYRADVGVVGDRIDAIGDLAHAEARRVVNAAGLTVAPGFIDTHTHSEGDLLVNPQHACGLRQGITTEFLGIDGMSYAPLSPENYRTYRHWLSGLLGWPPEDLDISSVAAFRANYHKKVAINTAYLVPNGTLREELGRVYMTEPRRANPERAVGGGGVPEALEIARRTGVKLHFAHYRTHPHSAGQVTQIMAGIDAAKAQGADVTLDIYPYATGSSVPISFLPSEAHEGGPP